MASLHSESFDRTVQRFKSRLSDEQKKMFASSDMLEVKAEMRRIQDEIGADKKLRNFTRLKKFLEGIKQVEQLVTIFLNVSEVVAFVWGPIKLGLLVASAKIDTLELLLDVYQEIGEVLHGVGKYDRLFRNYPDAREILERYFYDILEFHYGVLCVFSRPAWKKMFSYAWPTFKARFRPIIDSLKRHRKVLSDEKLTVIIEEVQECRDSTNASLQHMNNTLYEIQKAIKEQEMEHQKSQLEEKSVLLTKLEPPEYRKDQHSVYSRRHMESGDWITKDPRFQTWINGKAQDSSILYLHGIPGSGKTTLVSRIIGYITSQLQALDGILVYFYFGRTSQNGDNKSVSEMLRALLIQLMDQDDIIRECLYQKCAVRSSQEIQRESFLQELAEDCLASQRRLWIILDGLNDCEGTNECGRIESRRVIGWFQDKILCRNMGHGGPVRLIISGQRDGHLDQMLLKTPSVNLDATNAHLEDLYDFTKAQAASIKKRFSLRSEDEEEIFKRVTTVSKGMFLYAKVVLENLWFQDSAADLEEELGQDKFPQELSEAYERIAVRILDRPSRAGRNSAQQILSWVICSPRKLRWREIQSRFCIDPEGVVCNFKRRRVDTCKTLCGSFIEVEPYSEHNDSPSEQIISIVHETASKYLCHSGRVHFLEEHAKIAIFCSQYITSYPFTENSSTETIQELGIAGYFGFLDYAAACWQHHLNMIPSSEFNLNPSLKNKFHQAAKRALETWSPVQSENKEKGSKISDQMTRDANDMHVFETPGLRSQVFRIRNVLEAIDPNDLSDSSRASFFELDGTVKFKCPYLRCDWFSAGFTTEEDRDSHVRDHERPFKCYVDGCHARLIGYSTQGALDTHFKRFHPTSRNPHMPIFGRAVSKIPDIHAAAQQGDLDLLKTLHATGIDLNLPLSQKGSITPMILAVRHGHAHICQFLVSQGISISGEKYDKSTIIHGIHPIGEAIKRQDSEIFRLFWHNTMGLTSKDFSRIFQFIIQNGSDEFFEEVFSGTKSDKVQKALPSMMQGAARISYKDLAEGGTRLYLAQRRLLHTAMGRAFPNLYQKDRCTLKVDIRKVDAEPFSSCANTVWGTNILHAAIEYRSYSFIEFLLDFCSPVNVGQLCLRQNRNQMTALHFLIRKNEIEKDFAKICSQGVIRRVMKADDGKSANMGNINGDLPLHYCCRKPKSANVLPDLMEHTTDLNRRNKNGQTALELAVQFGAVEHVEILTKSDRVDISTETSSGKPWSSMTDNVHILKLLQSALLGDIIVVRNDSSEVEYST